MTETLRVKPEDYGLLVHGNGTVDLLVHDGRAPVSTPLAGLIGAYLLLRSDESFLDECLEAYRLYRAPSGNEATA